MSICDFDREIMRKSVDSGYVTVPRGLTPIQLREWLLTEFVPIPTALMERMEEIRALAEANRKKDAAK